MACRKRMTQRNLSPTLQVRRRRATGSWSQRLKPFCSTPGASPIGQYLGQYSPLAVMPSYLPEPSTATRDPIPIRTANTPRMSLTPDIRHRESRRHRVGINSVHFTRELLADVG